MSAPVIDSRKRIRTEDLEEVPKPPKKCRRSWRGREVSVPGTGSSTQVTPSLLQSFHVNFKNNPANRVIQNALVSRSIDEVALDYQESSRISHLFSNVVDMHPKPTDQKRSGRCWMFALLNCMRVEMMKKYDLPESFEFSQTYLFFFDKLEKANTFLNRMIKWADKPLEGDEVRSQLSSPVYDGGGWTMCANLIRKYGIVPKSAMKETFQSENSAKLNGIINYQVRQFTLELRKMVHAEKSVEEIQMRREEMLSVIYRILATSLGEPPKKFDWEYLTNKDKAFKRIPDLTPPEFYEEYIPYRVEDKILMINLPSAKTPYGNRYASWCANNTEEGPTETYLNLPYEKILPAVVRSIKDQQPVYFSCDVGKELSLHLGGMGISMFNYSMLFNTLFSMTKEERVATSQSGSTHAMVLCGVNLVDGKPNRWCIENSWGKTGEEGYLSATHGWMTNYSFKFAVDKKYLDPEVLELAEQKPIPMERTDPI